MVVAGAGAYSRGRGNGLGSRDRRRGGWAGGWSSAGGRGIFPGSGEWSAPGEWGSRAGAGRGSGPWAIANAGARDGAAPGRAGAIVWVLGEVLGGGVIYPHQHRTPGKKGLAIAQVWSTSHPAARVPIAQAGADTTSDRTAHVPPPTP